MRERERESDDDGTAVTARRRGEEGVPLVPQEPQEAVRPRVAPFSQHASASSRSTVLARLVVRVAPFSQRASCGVRVLRQIHKYEHQYKTKIHSETREIRSQIGRRERHRQKRRRAIISRRDTVRRETHSPASYGVHGAALWEAGRRAPRPSRDQTRHLSSGRIGRLVTRRRRDCPPPHHRDDDALPFFPRGRRAARTARREVRARPRVRRPRRRRRRPTLRRARGRCRP